VALPLTMLASTFTEQVHTIILSRQGCNFTRLRFNKASTQGKGAVKCIYAVSRERELRQKPAQKLAGCVPSYIGYRQFLR
jgi:hypothetical protein